MRLLLDSHILLLVVKCAIAELPPPYRLLFTSAQATFFASAASLWEIALKWRLGKLPLAIEPAEWPDILEQFEVSRLSVTAAHAVHKLEPAPSTRDPFDRMLLAQCQLEDLRLVTLDRSLLGHPLAWKPGSA